MSKLTLRAARINSGMGQEEVAKALEVSTRTISNWEHERTYPTIYQLVRLCKLYGVDVEDLFLPS